ncbi:lantibiotic ABC transporter permease [Streptococcus oralis]|uniref:Lantibiotic ABC transporter permease n=1 Tax=Streptococcus oralis subsp. oralis TaxID=1891914 RepID=A0A1X1I2E3_STROR|nr:lantibiotic ABC transporter permease [Streptococcus oralis]ORO67305.1 lantibiotic ABC transporter permease [Streptococcus oralis subsp. oralis]
MKETMSLLHSEWLKIRSTKAFKVSLVFMLLLVPVVSWLEGRQYSSVGLDATPETVPGLAEAIDPLEYLGLNGASMAGMALVVLAGILGAMEFQSHSLRTSLLSCNNRLKLLVGKLMTFTCFSLVVSFLSIYFSYMVMHLALGKEGLDPILLNQAAWSLILWKTLSLTLLGILSFLLGLLARTMLVPMLFLVPQIYNLGNYLAAHTSWGAYLPQPAGELFTATPTSQYANNPLQGLLILGAWILIIGGMTSLRFLKTDLGGRY